MLDRVGYHGPGDGLGGAPARYLDGDHVMTWPAVYAVTMLADRRQRRPAGCRREADGFGSRPPSRATVIVTFYWLGRSSMPGAISPISDIYCVGALQKR